MDDKQIEINRYNERAQEILNTKQFQIKIPSYLNSANEYYFRSFKKFKKKIKLLEIGAGTGENTSRILEMSFNVCATDISPKSVEAMNKKFTKYKNFSSKIADMEKLPFKNESFDIICSAGSLSYGDKNLVMNEIYRVLKLDGAVIFLDSLNNNPIYRFNRYLHYLKGNRSKNTIKRTPDMNLINQYIKKFGYGNVRYFGSITWTFPLLKLILSDNQISRLSDYIDFKINIKKFAFKIELILSKKTL